MGMQVDERIAFEQSGIATKKLSTLNIQKHLDSFNLESQFGTYSKIHALSGGQKVKVVLAAAMWMEPHVLILDEPTNFLDRDSLGALATAIKNYAGGVIIISQVRPGGLDRRGAREGGLRAAEVERIYTHRRRRPFGWRPCVRPFYVKL